MPDATGSQHPKPCNGVRTYGFVREGRCRKKPSFLRHFSKYYLHEENRFISLKKPWFCETSHDLNSRVYVSGHGAITGAQASLQWGGKPTVPTSRWGRQSSRLSESPHPPGTAALGRS